MILQFDVVNQKIIRKDNNYVVANSQFYLQMDFNFTADWQGFGKTITFLGSGKKYSIGLNTEDNCVVPYDVIKSPSFSFSIKGILDDVIITTNICVIPIQPSGETKGIAPVDPPKEILAGLQNGLKGQVLGKVSDDNYDYEFQNLKELQYDDENTLGDVLEGLVIDAVTDVKYEEGFLKKVENGETTNIVEVYDKETIDQKLENIDKYIQKSETPGLVKNDGTIDTTEYASTTQLSYKQDALSQTQLEAVDSGINATKVENYDNHIGNTSNPHNVTKEQVGLGNVENKSSETIRSEITGQNVITALGYTPGTSNFSGAYDDLSGKPDLSIYAQSSSLATVATSGDYNDLLNKPSIPVVDYPVTSVNGYIGAVSLTANDLNLGNVVNTGDSATPTQNGTSKFTNGGAYILKTQLETAIASKAQLFIIPNMDLQDWVSNEDEEFAEYDWSITVYNEDLVGALYVSVLFTHNQILGNNICGQQIVDNEAGTITFYSNDSSRAIIPMVYIFKTVE